MPKLELFTNRVEIDGESFPFNELKDQDESGDLVSVVYTQSASNVTKSVRSLYQLPYTEWTDSGDTPYASKAALLSDMKAFFFKVDGGGVVGDIETLGTSETDTTKLLAPDGIGGVAWNVHSANAIRVYQSNAAALLGGVIDSTKPYILEEIIDLTGLGVSIEVPSTGMTLIGYSFDLSGIKCSDIGYTLFTSPVGGSGNFLDFDLFYEIDGAGSQVRDIVSATNFDAIESSRINYNNCTSIGTIDGYRQGLETGTGRFGGTPELILKGLWSGGYFTDVSIVRGLTDGAYSLYKAGVGFLMSSRFRTNQNIDLPANVSFFDFAPVNFVNPSTLVVNGAIISRNGIFNSSDANITPNVDKGDLVCHWKGNNGMGNTFEGGSLGVSVEQETVISVQGDFYDIVAASWATLDLQHFDSPSNGQLRHLGNTPREFKVSADLTIDGGSNNVLTVRVLKYDASDVGFVTVLDQRRQVNALVGGRDVAFFNININTELDQNDYIVLQVANLSGTTNVTAEIDSYYIVEER